MPGDKLFFLVSHNFQNIDSNLDEIVGYNLNLIIKTLKVDRTAVFLFDERENVLRPLRLVTIHGEIGGEGEIYPNDRTSDPYFKALEAGKEVVHSQPEPAVYVPLIVNKKRIGVLMADNIFTGKKLKGTTVQALKKLADIFASGIQNMLSYQHLKQQFNKLLTLTKTGAAISTTLKLEEILKATLLSLVKDLGYDRAQIFLLDDTMNKVMENLSIDFRGEFRTANEAHPFIESLLFHSRPYSYLGKYSSSLISYVPINCKGKRTGLMVVDNLFTRQKLTSDDISFLTMLSDQIASVIENSRLFGHVERLSITDGLTGLFNHRYFYEKMSDELARSARFKSPLSLMMIDIDYFKKFNDKYGHQAGDLVLRTVSGIIQNNIRSIDIASRYGGEEMAIILPETDIRGAKVIAERIRHSIKRHEFRFNDESTVLTVSIGLVSYPEDATLKSDLINRADNALYWVKNNGRDGVCAYSECKSIL